LLRPKRRERPAASTAANTIGSPVVDVVAGIIHSVAVPLHCKPMLPRCRKNSGRKLAAATPNVYFLAG
jgi:hypothetical protein